MTTPTRVLQVARGELGYVEQSGNRTKYGRWYGMDGQPWCAMWSSWCLQQAGMPRSPMTHFAYTPSGYRAYEKAGRWHPSPRVGDLVFFAFSQPSSARPHGISHIGLVEAVEAGGGILTIEGNTDEAGGRTGGRVMRKRRAARIVGYGRPAYTTEEDIVTPAQMNELKGHIDEAAHRASIATAGRVGDWIKENGLPPATKQDIAERAADLVGKWIKDNGLPPRTKEHIAELTADEIEKRQAAK